MSAQLVADDTLPFSGLRPLDPRRDLEQVADLIETAFAGELDHGGLAALREMRMLARMGPFVGMVVRADPLLEQILGGFVWIEENEVVGNVTLQRLDPYGNRWQIANVAVATAHQRRGIARQLVMAALERIEDQGSPWAVLQVRADNEVARGLYERLGFERVTEETVLRMAGLPGPVAPVEPPAGLRAYREDEWRARFELELAARTALAQWWRPVRPQHYWRRTEARVGEKFWELIGRSRVRRWVLPGRHGLGAWLQIDARRWDGAHCIEFSVHPSLRGQVEKPLVDYALAFLNDYPRWPIRVQHQGEHEEMIDALRQAGFGIVRSLVCMRKKVIAGRPD